MPQVSKELVLKIVGGFMAIIISSISYLLKSEIDTRREIQYELQAVKLENVQTKHNLQQARSELKDIWSMINVGMEEKNKYNSRITRLETIHHIEQHH